jgi:hypothetical protein
VRSHLAPALLVVIVGVAACAARGPVLDTGSKPVGVGGTIAGSVRVAGSGQPLASRKVSAIDVSSGQRYEASTATNGGYTIKVPRGKYRLEVELREGETLTEQPSETEINASDLDAGRDFTVTVKASPVPGLSDLQRACSSAAIRTSSGGCVEKNIIQPRAPLIFSVASASCEVSTAC